MSDDVLAQLARPAHSEPCPDAQTWFARYRALALTAPIDRALLAGHAADRLAWAFASGYQAAGERLFGPTERMRALCATESGGNHPRAIETTLTPAPDGHRLTGDKRFVTFGPEAEALLVVASVGRDGDRNQLRLCQIPSDRDGVTVTPAGADIPFVPEIPHGAVRFDAVWVAADEILAGDGYADFLKPFRTVEDIHVHAAVLAWLLATGWRAGWPRHHMAMLLANVVTLRSLAAADPKPPATHLALAGALAGSSALIASLDWTTVAPAVRAGWERDRALLQVAGKARSLRFERAWERLAGDAGVSARDA